MSNPFNEQYLFNGHPSANVVIPEYPCIEPSDSTLDWLTDPLQAPEFAYNSWIPHDNALGLSGMNKPESVRAADPFACPSATTTWDETDRQFFSTSVWHQLSPPPGVLRPCQPPAPHYSSVRGGTALVGVEGTLVPDPAYPVTLPEYHPVQKPAVRSPDKHVNASRSLVQSTSPSTHSLRHSPYPIGPDSTRRSASPVSFHQCQWFDGTRPCGALVAGAKNAIGQHLQRVHGLRLKADKTIQVCHWEMCQKPMRRESIPRHILAVHMQDKVLCPSCGSRFARTDSMQRHQKMQCLAQGEASDACKAEGELACRT